MKYLCSLLLILAAGVMLNAQTNPAAPESATPAPALVAPTNAAARVRPPTEIHSTSGEFNLKSNVFVYTENVRVDDPQMKLTCDLLTVAAPKLTQGKFNQAVADGHVVIDWQDEKGQPNHATANRAVYTYSITNTVTNAIVELTGNAIVTNTQITVVGEPIIWNRLDGRISYTNGFTKVHQAGPDAPNLFEGFSTSKTNTPKPAPAASPQ
jgi:lipopolysaccharide transport protein LptA